MRLTSHIIVVGGGISGMSTALALKDLATERGLPPPQLLVLEAEERVGGRIGTLHTQGFACDWSVNGFLKKEPKTLELCQRLGLEHELQPASSAFAARYLYTRGKLRPIHMHPLRFMLSGLLPWRAKLRLLGEPLVRSRSAEDESVAAFARRRIGTGAFEVLVDSMQTGIYAGDPEQMSVKACFPRVVEVEQQYGSLIRGMVKLQGERRRRGEANSLPGAGPAGHLTSFRGGMQTLVDALERALAPQLVKAARVERVCRAPDAQPGFTVWVSGRPAPFSADAVVLACPAFEAARITDALDPQLGRTLAEIPYAPLAVVCLGFPRESFPHPLQGFGFLAPRSAGLRALGALWTSSLFPEQAPPEAVLLRVMIGGARDPGALELDDAALASLAVEEMRRVHGGGDPSFVHVFRHPQGIPQYVLGHVARVQALEASVQAIPGLFITGNAYRGISVNDCARNAHLAAAQVLDYLG